MLGKTAHQSVERDQSTMSCTLALLSVRLDIHPSVVVHQANNDLSKVVRVPPEPALAAVEARIKPRHLQTHDYKHFFCWNVESRRSPSCDIVVDAIAVLPFLGPGRYCSARRQSPLHRVPFSSINEAAKYESMTWREMGLEVLLTSTS
jgi:hypothetical protein